MVFWTRGLVTSILLLGIAQAAAAAVSIQYTVVPVSGSTYKYVYSVTNMNAAGGASVQLFDIFFDNSLYSSLSIVSPGSINANWSQQILPGIIPGPPAAYDSLSIFGGGIPPGGTVTGFAVQFTWLGAGTPGAQPFQIYDPSTTPITLLQNGATFLSTSIPASSTFSLILLGLGLAAASAVQARGRLQLIR